MTHCKQCRMDGHHKMSCTDDSNPARKDRVTVSTSLKEPIVEGAYYEREDGSVGRCGAPNSGFVHVLDDPYRRDSGERVYDNTPRLTRRVYLVHTDPAEVVAELTKLARKGTNIGFESAAYDRAADLVAEKLGVKS